MESSSADTGAKVEKTVPIFGPVDRELLRKYRSPTAICINSIIKSIIETLPVTTTTNPIQVEVGAGNRGTNSVPKSLPIPLIKSPATAASLTEGNEDALTDMHGSPSQANDAKAAGHKLLGAGKYEDALLQFELALQIASEGHSPEFRSICHESRAICFRRLGRYADTIRESTKALGLNPSYIKALQSRGEAFGMQGNFEAAIADLKKVHTLDPLNERTVRDIRYLERRLARKQEWIKRNIMRFLEPARMKVLTDSMPGHINERVNTVRCVRNPNTGS